MLSLKVTINMFRIALQKKPFRNDFYYSLYMVILFAFETTMDILPIISDNTKAQISWKKSI